ncbi:paraquat-inducible protein A [Alcaligenaceae bacterium CGII-47]|nr:paraquat-inducible protein A [Alcaligenaceae bacterium CGII-47]
MASHGLIACSHCGALHKRIELEARAQALCVRCATLLYRRSMLSISGWMAITLTAFVVFAIAQYFPIVSLSLQGKTISPSFPQALLLTWDQGHYFLSIMTGLFGFWFPLFQLVLVFWALHCISVGRIPGDFALGLRVLRALAPWSMAPVLVLALIVAIVKFSGFAFLRLEWGLLGFALLTFFLTGVGRMHARALWYQAERAGLVGRSGEHGHELACQTCDYVQDAHPPGGRCRRCHATAHRRRHNVTARVWALALAASVVYIPANVLPVMRISSPFGSEDHTILGGVIELWQLGSWDLALIVFVASVVVPITKLLALMVLMIWYRPGGALLQRQRTRLYELVEYIGQWSMLDVFVVVLMGAMANFPGLTQIVAGPGAFSFGMVVVLTMWAAMSYDPRLGWDQLSENHV